MSDVAEKPTPILSRLPQSLVQEVDAFATETNISRNGAVAQLLETGLRAKRKKGARHG